jgi:crotonobetainyl-CoA:carnitine CoA-transferase CaiB-like acyl-CoA transferase
VLSPLSGCTVVELGEHISAPYASRMLGDLGADVIKVESPDGDSARNHGPFPGPRDPEQSGLFHVLNFNKRGIVLDLNAGEDRERLDALLTSATIFISNLPVARRRSAGFDLATVTARHPHLVAVAVTAYGDSGPYAGLPGCALTATALSAASWVIGQPDREPLTLPYDLADYTGGANAAAAALAALFGILRGGPGQGVDIAISDLISSFVQTNARMYIPYEKPWVRAGRSASGSGGSFPYMILPCRDGYVALIGRGQRDWDNIVDAMETPAWTQEERFRDPFRIARQCAPEATRHLGAWFAGRRRDELLEIARRHGFALAPVRSIAEILMEPQFEHRELFLEPIALGDRILTPPGSCYALSGWPAPRSVRPAPRLGEHTAEVFDALQATTTPAGASR